jgi:hypothetical protein
VGRGLEQESKLNYGKNERTNERKQLIDFSRYAVGWGQDFWREVTYIATTNTNELDPHDRIRGLGDARLRPVFDLRVARPVQEHGGICVCWHRFCLLVRSSCEKSDLPAGKGFQIGITEYFDCSQRAVYVCICVSEVGWLRQLQ